MVGRVRARPLFLLGMMGAGKSSVGRELARREGVVFVDLDERIQRLFASSIAELFELGEAYFRACERSALTSLLREPGFASTATIVATGGGVVTRPENLALMADVGDLVFVDVDVETLAARLSTPAQRERRPLLHDGDAALVDRLRALLDARRSAYLEAGHVVDGRGTVAEVTEEIARATT